MKTNRILLLAAFTLSCFLSIAQSPASQTYFGTAGLDFRTIPPTPLTNSAMNSLEACASMCNDMGDLLFYTDGGPHAGIMAGDSGGVYNANHVLMDNGLLLDSAGCKSSDHGVVAVPIPDDGNGSNDGLYYIFFKDCVEADMFGFHYGLTYAIVDMNANGGLGKVTTKYQTILPHATQFSTANALHESLGIVYHANQNDYWLFSYYNDSLVSQLVTSSGIGTYRAYDELRGTIKISPSGEHLFAGTKLYAFDKATGNLTFMEDLPLNRFPSFSASGRYFYDVDSSQVFQYDVQAPVVSSSKTSVGSIPTTFFTQFFLAPDHKIYFFERDDTQLFAVLNCPNAPAALADLVVSGISLNGKKTGDTFTNLLVDYLYEAQSACYVGIDEMNETNFSIYPSISSGIFNIESRENGSYHIVVTDVSGKLVHDQKDVQGDQLLDLGHLAQGMYHLNIRSGESSFFRKMLIQK